MEHDVANHMFNLKKYRAFFPNSAWIDGNNIQKTIHKYIIVKLLMDLLTFIVTKITFVLTKVVVSIKMV